MYFHINDHSKILFMWFYNRISINYYIFMKIGMNNSFLKFSKVYIKYSR